MITAARLYSTHLGMVATLIRTCVYYSFNMPLIDQESNILCAELIVLNYLLSEFPETPSQTRTSQSTPSNKQYRLPFSIERDLVETLSFLSKTQDGPDYIPAVCVEQDQAGDHLNVLLAVNKCSWNDGDDILRSLKERFEDIFHVLCTTEYGRMYHFTQLFIHILISTRAWRFPRNQTGDFQFDYCHVLTQNSLSVTPCSKQTKRNQAIN